MSLNNVRLPRFFVFFNHQVLQFAAYVTRVDNASDHDALSFIWKAIVGGNVHKLNGFWTIEGGYWKRGVKNMFDRACYIRILKHLNICTGDSTEASVYPSSSQFEIDCVPKVPAAVAVQPPSKLKFVLITGKAGVGKSLFLYRLLIAIRQVPKNHDKRILFIQGDGERVVLNPDGTTEKYVYRLHNHPPIVLSDSVDLDRIQRGCELMVLVSSFAGKNFKEFVKRVYEHPQSSARLPMTELAREELQAIMAENGSNIQVRQQQHVMVETSGLDPKNMGVTSQTAPMSDSLTFVDMFVSPTPKRKRTEGCQ